MGFLPCWYYFSTVFYIHQERTSLSVPLAIDLPTRTRELPRTKYQGWVSFQDLNIARHPRVRTAIYASSANLEISSFNAMSPASIPYARSVTSQLLQGIHANARDTRTQSMPSSKTPADAMPRRMRCGNRTAKRSMGYMTNQSWCLSSSFEIPLQLGCFLFSLWQKNKEKASVYSTEFDGSLWYDMLSDASRKGRSLVDSV
jgi:hypothetical protein